MRRRHRLGTLVGAVLAVVGLLVLCSPATAADKSLESVLENVDWGDSKDEVLKKLKKQKMAKLRQKEELKHNRVKMQQARRRAMDEIDRIENSYTELDEGGGGYKVSVIANEFTRGNNEALLKVDDRAAQRFYMFVDGSLYKLVIAYKESYLQGVDFESFVGQVAGKYGSTDETESRDISGENTMARAIWKSSTTTLKAENQKEFFGTFSLVFSDRQRVKQMRANNENFGGSDKSAAEISDRVGRLKEGSDEDENADVVDGMVGEEVDLDMKRNAKLEEQGPEADEQRKTDDQQESSDQKAETGRSKSQGSASAASQQQESSDEEEKDREFDNLEADKKDDGGGDDDELIVY